MTIKCFNVWTAIEKESGDLVVALLHPQYPMLWIKNYYLGYYPLNFVKDQPEYQGWMLEGSMKKMLLTIGLEEVEEPCGAEEKQT